MITHTPSDITIIVVGNWNTNIFQPDWIINNLLKDTKIAVKKEEIGLFFDLVNKEIGYSINNIGFYPKAKALEIKAEKSFESNDLELMTCLLNNTLKSLPHTPISGIGINFDFNISKNENIEIINWYNKVLTNTFEELSFAEFRVNKKLDNCIQNIVFSDNKDKVKIDINFHYNSIVDFNLELFKEYFKISLNYLK